jgi:hypothetical protein
MSESFAKRLAIGKIGLDSSGLKNWRERALTTKYAKNTKKAETGRDLIRSTNHRRFSWFAVLRIAPLLSRTRTIAARPCW